MKTRLDVWLTKQGLAPSRQRAQSLILTGCVLVNGVPAQSVAQSVTEQDAVLVKGKDHPYVSRGGVKLAHAIETFSLPIEDCVAIDVGASSGGFTDCLLKHGARKVYAVDVGYGQLDWTLRQDPRVIVIERCNVRHWEGKEIEDAVDLVTIDVSFISLRLVVPAVKKILSKDRTRPDVALIALIKPQFEAGRKEVGSGGVVRDVTVQERVVQEISDFVAERGWQIVGTTPSPIQGPKGNQEYFLVAKIKQND